MPDIEKLCSDLRDEHEALDAVVVSLSDEEWDLVTPAAPWTVRDQIAHLSFFDGAAAMAVASPDDFLSSLSAAAEDVEGYMNAPLEEARVKPVVDVLEEWRSSRNAMLDVFRRVEPGVRIPWYGPAMSPASFISARLMETWAHGQDICDTVGTVLPATSRLKHVCHLGVRARGYSYVVNSMDDPGTDVTVRLTAPDGTIWEWGSAETDVITGPALDFCLVVSQRRHLDDVDLSVTGPDAVRWMTIAQCFAGPPGEGRRPGQFSKG